MTANFPQSGPQAAQTRSDLHQSFFTCAQRLAPGQVQFYLDGQKLDPARPVLPDGTAKQALPQLSPGQHTVTALYSGDNFYNTSTSESLTINP